MKAKLVRIVVITTLTGFALVGGTYLLLVYLQEKNTLDIEARKKIKGRFIELSQGTVRYEIYNPGGNDCIVLIPGAGSGIEVWEKPAKVLADSGYKVLAFDLYGRGFSDRPDIKYKSSVFLKQLLELADSLNLPDRVHVASLSMGGIVAIDFCVNHPERVKSICMINPAALNTGLPWYLKAPVISDFLMTTYWMPRATENQMQEFCAPDSFPDYRELLENQMYFSGYKHAAISTWKHTLNRPRKTEIKQLGALPFPKLLLWGRNDTRTRLPQSQFYLDNVPDLEFHIIDQCGHIATYEKSEEVARKMLQFYHSQDSL